jgi:hypothetical protein
VSNIASYVAQTNVFKSRTPFVKRRSLRVSLIFVNYICWRLVQGSGGGRDSAASVRSLLTGRGIFVPIKIESIIVGKHNSIMKSGWPKHGNSAKQGCEIRGCCVEGCVEPQGVHFVLVIFCKSLIDFDLKVIAVCYYPGFEGQWCHQRTLCLVFSGDPVFSSLTW